MAFNYHRVLQVWAIPLLLVAFFRLLSSPQFFICVWNCAGCTFPVFCCWSGNKCDGSSEKPYFMDQEFLVSKHFISFFNLHPHNLKSVWLTHKGGWYPAYFLSQVGRLCELPPQDPNVWEWDFMCLYFLEADPTSLYWNLPGEKWSWTIKHLVNDPG